MNWLQVRMLSSDRNCKFSHSPTVLLLLLDSSKSHYHGYTMGFGNIQTALYLLMTHWLDGICVPLHQFCSLAPLNKAVTLYRLVVLYWFGSQLLYKKENNDSSHSLMWGICMMGNSDTSQWDKLQIFLQSKAKQQ